MTTKNIIKSGLYIVSTPIGNLQDITYRAIDVLSLSDVILCEDTRVSLKLLSAYNIKNKLISLHEYNERGKIQYVLNLLSQNKIISLISDAGTPLISDPGYHLVKNCINAGYYVTSIPGACSVVTALTLSTFPTNTFFFAGFLPNKSNTRIKFLNNIKNIKSTLIFFETANRLLDSLIDISSIFPKNEIAIVQELTKLFEHVSTDTTINLINQIKDKKLILKGEIILLISNSKNIDSSEKINNDININDPKLTTKQISKILSEKSNIPVSDIYKMLHRIKNLQNIY